MWGGAHAESMRKMEGGGYTKMTHKCFSCDGRFTTSALLVQHMKDHHSTFVENAEQKIDQSKDFSTEMAMAPPKGVACCPFCRKDCLTRKKLMYHLELKHRDEDIDDEPEVKVIRFDQRKGLPVSSQSYVGADVRTVHHLIHVYDPKLQNATTESSLAAAALQLPEKRYKCFWCEASFRKRGKLMDHIDMFHKANKQQTEAEAESLQGTSKNVPAESTTEEPITAIYNLVPFVHTSATNTLVTMSPSHVPSGTSSKMVVNSSASPPSADRPRRSTTEKTNLQVPSSTPRPAYHPVCVFTVKGRLLPKIQPPRRQNEAVIDICKFYHEGNSKRTRQSLARKKAVVAAQPLPTVAQVHMAKPRAATSRNHTSFVELSDHRKLVAAPPPKNFMAYRMVSPACNNVQTSPSTLTHVMSPPRFPVQVIQQSSAVHMPVSMQSETHRPPRHLARESSREQMREDTYHGFNPSHHQAQGHSVLVPSPPVMFNPDAPLDLSTKY